jgi:DNA-binding HxlR family transcriptional regulator
MPPAKQQALHSPASIRAILDQVASKWSVMILILLCDKPQRFNAIRRNLDGITQKALTESLRRLERSWLVARRVIPVSPVAVEYSLTRLGQSLREPFVALYRWSADHQAAIERAQQVFDRNKQKASNEQVFQL